MDIKSTTLILCELLEIYKNFDFYSSNLILNNKDINKQVLSNYCNPIPPPLDCLLPFYPSIWFFLNHFHGLLKRHAFKLPDRLHHTNLPNQNNIINIQQPNQRKFGWTTKLILRSISKEISISLIEKSKSKNISIESLCYVSMMFAVARVIYQNHQKNQIRLWGVLVKDMRNYKKQKKIFDKKIGVLFSLLDFVCSFNDSNIINHENIDFLWERARKITDEIQLSLESGNHLSSMVFTEYISKITSLYSKYFTTPGLSPSFGLYYIGNMDENFDEFYQLHKNSTPSVNYFTAANGSTTSFPLPIVTCFIHNQQLSASLTYSSETSSNQAMNNLMDEFTGILTSL